MILYNENWNEPVHIKHLQPTTIILNNINELYLFQQHLLEQITEGEGYLTIFNNEKSLNFGKEIEFIPNLLTLSLNSRKTINFLHKNIIEEVAKKDLIIEFEEIKKEIKEWLKAVRKTTFIDFEFNDELEVKDILKLTKIKFSERENKITELFIKYLDLLNSITSTKILFISLSLYLLPENEIKMIIDHCTNIGITIVFIEKENHNFNIPINKVTIVDDFVLK